jgi:transcriptional regulator with XRE-family HTH domain
MGDQEMTEEKRAIIKKRIKLKALAEIAGCNYSYLSSIINGQRKPSADLAARLAQSCSYMTNATFTIEDFRGQDNE